MKTKFTVKNFGPIQNASLQLRNVNIFIGSQGSGKSVLAKLYSICRSALGILDDDHIDSIKSYNYIINGVKGGDLAKFKSCLEDYNIKGFLNSTTYIEFDCESHRFVFDKGKIFFTRKHEKDIDHLVTFLNSGKDADLTKVVSIVKKYFESIYAFRIVVITQIFEKLHGKDATNDYTEYEKFEAKFEINKIKWDASYISILLGALQFSEKNILASETIYVPAERIIVQILKDSALGLQKNDIPIPKHILSFAAAYERASNKLKELDLGFIMENAMYKRVNGKDKLYISPKKSFLLSEAATGFQSVIPLLVVLSETSSSDASDDVFSLNPSFVIEEPEISLFPATQYKLMKYLEGRRQSEAFINSSYTHIYTTHSPYILASFNNMLYAYKKARELSDEKKIAKLDLITGVENWLDPDIFSAYSINDGKAVSIFDRKQGLIKRNKIDAVTEDLNEDFDKMLAI